MQSLQSKYHIGLEARLIILLTWFYDQPEYLEDEINDYKNEKIWELMGKY